MSGRERPKIASCRVEDDSATRISGLIHARRTVRPRHLHAPGPNHDQLARMLRAAAAAPDHGELRPWRFILVPPDARPALADAFELAIMQRDALAATEQRERAREKAYYGATLLLAVARLLGGNAADTPDHERFISAGCAIQNMLLVATALGFGSALTSGQAMAAEPVRRLFALRDTERALCFVAFGTAARTVPPRREPDEATYFSVLDPGLVLDRAAK